MISALRLLLMKALVAVRSARARVTLALAALVLVTGGPMVTAQSDTRSFFLREQRPTFRLFGDPQPAPALRPAVRRPSQPLQLPRRVAPSTVVVDDTPEKPVVEATTFVAVLGDSLADLLVYGLGEAFSEVPEVAIVRKTKPNSGLVRADFHDWPKAVTDLLASPEKLSFAVMMLGANDRQPIREGETSLEPLSERWRELYVQRIEAIARAFAERKIPLLWVGMPPMKNERLSADMITLNEMFRDRVQRNGGLYVDLWEAFVDAENRFAISGPDLSGQITRLRTADGVHLTRAGARKAAHFVEIELKRLLDTRGPSAVVAVQSPKDLGSGVPGITGTEPAPIEISLPALPEPAGVPAISTATRPLAGPILPLTRIEASPGALLMSRNAVVQREAGQGADQVLVQGRPPEAVPGRADDFRWPR